jgi:hypothetical protein
MLVSFTFVSFCMYNIGDLKIFASIKMALFQTQSRDTGQT